MRGIRSGVSQNGGLSRIYWSIRSTLTVILGKHEANVLRSDFVSSDGKYLSRHKRVMFGCVSWKVGPVKRARNHSFLNWKVYENIFAENEGLCKSEEVDIVGFEVGVYTKSRRMANHLQETEIPSRRLLDNRRCRIFEDVVRPHYTHVNGLVAKLA